MLPPTPTPDEPSSGESLESCARHEDRPAHSRCARCGRGACVECTTVLASGESRCPACEPSEGGAIPWEQRRELGLARAALQTITGVLARPRWLFGQRTREVALWPTLLFGLALHVAGTAAATGWNLAFAERTRAELRADPVLSQFVWMASDEAFLAQLALSPLLFLLVTYLQASLWWIALRAVGGLRRPFHVIVRALCFAQAPSLLVPFVTPLGLLGAFGQGVSLAFGVWVLWLQIVAVSRMQGIEVARGGIAFLLWVALAGCLTCLLGTVTMGALASQIRIPTP